MGRLSYRVLTIIIIIIIIMCTSTLMLSLKQLACFKKFELEQNEKLGLKIGF